MVDLITWQNYLLILIWFYNSENKVAVCLCLSMKLFPIRKACKCIKLKRKVDIPSVSKPYSNGATMPVSKLEQDGASVLL